MPDVRSRGRQSGVVWTASIQVGIGGRLISLLQHMGRAIYRGAAKVLAGTGVSALPGLRTLNALFVAGLRGKTVEVDGHRFHLDPTDSLSLSVMGSFEPAETQLILRRVRPGAIVLDIGANIGYFTLLLARCTGPSGHVYAFEPEPDNFKLLLRNVGENGYGNVTCVQAAAGASNGTIALYLSKEGAADHRVAPDDDARQSIEVRLLRIDDYLTSIDHADFIKVDVQGAEFAVLGGMEHLLKNSPSVEMLIEYWPFGLARAGVEPRALLDLLDRHGFRLHVCALDRELTGPVPVDRLANRFTVDSKRFLNLFATRATAV